MWTMSTSCLTSLPGMVTTGVLAHGQPAAGSAVQVRVSFFLFLKIIVMVKILLLKKHNMQYKLGIGNMLSGGSRWPVSFLACK